MKKSLIFSLVVLTSFTVVFAVFFYSNKNTIANQEFKVEADEPDMPGFLKDARNGISKEDFLSARWEGIALKRGIAKDVPFDPSLRSKAIKKMEKQEKELAIKAKDSFTDNALLAAWVPIGPAPIPNGQTSPTAAVSGRVISIAIHPTNANIVYVGTAQGGVYRTTNGGTTWVPIFDSAVSLAIGAIAISPSSPETVYVGTGEPNSSLDSFFGYGLYRIDNASTTATLNGPIGGNEFAGNSISKIIVHPTDPATIFVSSSGGNGGIRPVGVPGPNRGVYRSTNATSANPTFTGFGFIANVRDMAIDPSNPNILVINYVAGGGGLFRLTDALAPTPSTPTQVLAFSCTSTGTCNGELASQKSAGASNATFYVATGDSNGQVWVSTNGGANWTMQIDNDFCGGQCFYDIAIAVDPTNPQNVYLGGDPTIISARSTNGGLSFTDNNAGVHGDTHALAVAPSSPSTVYLGTDGGIYKSTNSGVTWTPLNNSQFSATQFMSIDVHPTDPNFTLGGTQDNGTNFYQPNGTWTRADFGDGGYAQIDQNAANTTNVRMYHTYFNNGSLQGYGTVSNVANAQDNGWAFRGCSGAGNTGNGITCTGSVNFYAPLERGPGNPNTIYYGTDRLYRSADTGLTHTVVSQAPLANSGSPISAIGISPQNDNVRIVGTNSGVIAGTTTGSATMVDFDPNGVVPNVPINRTIIDPNNQNTAYVALSAFGINSVYKTTNLNASPPTWTNASGTGGTSIPQVPVSSFVVDPQNSNNLYAGTDIGVYASTDGGNTWVPFGTGLPRVAVFGMAITNANPRKLRIATHGRGMYEIGLSSSSLSKAPFDYDGDGKTDISIFRPGPGQWWTQKSSNLVVTANTFGVSSDTIVPADFTGDGKTDIAFFRPTTGEWFVQRSEDSSFFAFPFGTNGDIPTPGDFDGDGKADAAVFRPSNSTWFINNSGGGTTIQTFGASGDLPIAQDFDGDGKTDLAVYRPSLSQWFYQRSSNMSVRGFQFGSSGDKAAPLDYTGDGKADIAFFRPSTGTWFVLRSEDDSFFAFPFGTSTDLPVPGDYDGDGKADAAIFRPGNVTWFINGTQAGFIIQAFGIAGDKPTPNAYVR